MPVANIMEIHEEVLNSGVSSSLPSGIRPNLLTAMTMTKIVKIEAAMMKSQPKLSMTPVSRLPATAPRLSGERKPQTTKATARMPAEKNTTLSRPSRLNGLSLVVGCLRCPISS